MKEKARDSNFEALRIISILLIISFHYVFHGNLIFKDGSKVKILADFIRMFGELGVNCFALITGYYMIHSTFKTERLASILFEAEFYYVLSILIAVRVGLVSIDEYSSISLWIMPVTLGRWWYTSAYVCLYLMSPFINKLLLTFSKEDYKKYLCTILIIWCVIPTFLAWKYTGCDTERLLYYNRMIWLIIMYSLGAYIRVFESYFKEKRRIAVKLFIGITIFIIVFIIIINLMINSDITTLLPPDYFWQPNTIIMTVWSILLFIIFLNMNIKNNTVINYFAKGTLGIYMLHDGLLRRWWWDDVFKSASYVDSYGFLLNIILSVISIFVIGTIIDQVRRWIWAALLHEYKKSIF